MNDAKPFFDTAFQSVRAQTLSSGLTIRQDFRLAVRFVMFQTEIEECPYATDGGTLFVVNYRNKVYGVTCGHVIKGFELRQLIITGKKYPKMDDKPAWILGQYFPTSPQGAASDSDILDVCIIDFKPQITPSFFSDPAYIIDENTICTSHNGHKLLVSGCLKDLSTTTESDINAGFARLEYQDAGTASFDPLLRTAVAEFAQPTFGRVTGLSGAPVYDLTENALCGVVMRGAMTKEKSTIHFLDAVHIVEMLKMIDQGNDTTSYARGVWQEVKTPLLPNLP